MRLRKDRMTPDTRWRIAQEPIEGGVCYRRIQNVAKLARQACAQPRSLWASRAPGSHGRGGLSRGRAARAMGGLVLRLIAGSKNRETNFHFGLSPVPRRDRAKVRFGRFAAVEKCDCRRLPLRTALASSLASTFCLRSRRDPPRIVAS